MLDLSEGDKIASMVQANKLLLLQNHGLLTIGHRGVDEACFYFIAADRACQVQLLAEAAGKPVFIDHDVAVPLGGPRPHVGARFSFASYYDVVAAEQPDLFD